MGNDKPALHALLSHKSSLSKAEIQLEPRFTPLYIFATAQIMPRFAKIISANNAKIILYSVQCIVCYTGRIIHV